GLSQERAAALDVAAEVEGCDKRGGDDFGVGQLASAVVLVADGLEQVIHNAVECGRVIDHRSPPVFVWRRDGGDFPLLSKNETSLNQQLGLITLVYGSRSRLLQRWSFGCDLMPAACCRVRPWRA